MDDEENYSFNPFHLKDDENGGNKIGMANVLGKKFVEERTPSCEYHLQESVKRHSKYVKLFCLSKWYEKCDYRIGV